MKVFSYLRNTEKDYVNEKRLEGFDATKHWKHLGDYDNREFFSFDPEFVTLQEQDEAFDVTVYDAEKDADFLDSLHNKLPYLRQDLQDIKAKMFMELDLFDIITGIVSKDKYVIKKLEAIAKEHEEHLKNLGF